MDIKLDPSVPDQTCMQICHIASHQAGKIRYKIKLIPSKKQKKPRDMHLLSGAYTQDTTVIGTENRTREPCSNSGLACCAHFPTNTLGERHENHLFSPHHSYEQNSRVDGDLHLCVTASLRQRLRSVK